jgi:hypothetical protein
MPDDNKKPNKIEVVNLRETGEGQIKKVEKAFENSPVFEALKNLPEKPEINHEKLEISAGKEGAGGPEKNQVNIVQMGVASQEQKEREKAIEKVLEKDLEDIFIKMNNERRQEFALKGEETAKNINSLLEKGTATAAKIIDLIKKWLGLIPGVNKFFVEQEAKLKADEIMKKNNQRK